MKNFKKISLLIVTTLCMFSCEKETFNLEENIENNSQVIEKSDLKSKDDIIIAYYNVEGNLFALDDDSDIYSFEYDVLTDAIQMTNFRQDAEDATDEYKNFSIDRNPNDGFVYLLAGYDGDGDRYIFRYDMENGTAVKISDALESAEDDNEYPIKISFDADGNCYIAFGNGEINKYDIETNIISSFSNVDYSSKVGLTYDFDNNRLIYATDRIPVELYAIDIPSGDVTFLFDFSPSFNERVYAVALEYVGDNKLLAGDMSYGEIYTIDMLDQSSSSNSLIDTDDYVMDLMYYVDPDVDGDGVLNENDPFPNSNMDESLSIGEYSFDIENQFSSKGTTMMDQIDALMAEINEQYDGSNGDALHRMFTRELSKITYYWYKSRLISRRDRVTISNAANSANIPYVDFD
jgi:hypothetical protein